MLRTSFQRRRFTWARGSHQGVRVDLVGDLYPDLSGSSLVAGNSVWISG